MTDMWSVQAHVGVETHAASFVIHQGEHSLQVLAVAGAESAIAAAHPPIATASMAAFFWCVPFIFVGKE